MRQENKFYTPRSIEELLEYIIIEKEIFYEQYDETENKTSFVRINFHNNENIINNLRNFIETESNTTITPEKTFYYIDIKNFAIPYLRMDTLLNYGFWYQNHAISLWNEQILYSGNKWSIYFWEGFATITRLNDNSVLFMGKIKNDADLHKVMRLLNIERKIVQ